MSRTVLRSVVAVLLGLVGGAGELLGQAPPTEPLPPLGTHQGEKYDRLVIRNAMIVSGRGTPWSGRGMPAEGPVDIIIEGDRIVDLVPADPVSLGRYRPGFERPSGDRVIDATGMYVIPGLIDMHAHIPGDGERAGPRGLEYGFRLWLAHGVTMLRDPGAGAGLDVLVEQRRLSEQNRVVAPRLFLYKRWPQGGRSGDPGHTPDEARALVRRYREEGADGIKVSKGPGHYPDVLEAIADEARQLGMGVAVDLKVSEADAVVASNAGVTSIEHWYGIPDAALSGSQRFPPDYNYQDELDRFRYAGYLWEQAEENPDRILGVLDLMIANGTYWDPTFVVYEANRDITRALNLPWRERYAHPDLLEYWEPNPSHHASYHSEWKTSDEVAWKRNYDIWMRYVREFADRGGRVILGSDAGSLQALYGFSTIRELELLQEAGFHPIDIIRIATTGSAEALGVEDLCGIRIGCLADLAVIDGNPLDDFKVMYGGGERGGVRWTIKGGVVFDAPALLREVEWYVEQAKEGAATTAGGR